MAAQLEVALGGTPGSWAPASNKKRKSGAAGPGYWEEERDMVVQLMMGRPHHLLHDVNRPSSPSSASPPPQYTAPFPILQPCTTTTTLDLLGGSASTRLAPPPLPFPGEDASSSSCCFDLDSPSPLPSGWEKCLDLQTGSIYYLNRSTGVSTSCDPRKPNTSSVNWPTSPSSSSDLTYEANVQPMVAASKPLITTNFIEGPNYESTNLDLTLSLKPSSPRLRRNSLNQSLNHEAKSDLNHNLRSLISSQGLLNNQSSSVSSLHFNSSRHSKASYACTSSTTSPSSPSTLFFQELSGHKEMGSSISSKESKIMSKNQSLIDGMCRPILSNNLNSNINMNGREKPIIRETKATISETHIMNMNSASSSPNMMTVGCANCLMFVMLPKSCSPKCPRCGASIDSDLPQPPAVKKPKLGFSLM